jgi:hypothetical protein
VAKGWQQRLGWYAKRAAVMGPPELVHRAREQGGIALMRLRYLAGARWPEPGPVERFSFCTGQEARLPALDWDRDALQAAAGDLLRGRVGALGFSWQWSAGAQTWHRAPDTGASWPSCFFAAVPYREGNGYGDVRVVWEPARLQWLVGLGLLAVEDDGADGDRAILLLEQALESWLDANPPLCGVHYVSAMECALRLIAVCHALDLARVRLAQPQVAWSALLRLIASHARFIERRLSLYSSAGNHTIAEGAGLVYAGVLFPEFRDARRWRRLGLHILSVEARRQILADGGGVEQAFCYLLFITELLGLVVAVMRHHGGAPPPEVSDAFERGRGFLRAMAAGGALPAIGDGDDGRALSPFLRLALPPRPEAHSPDLKTFPVAGYSLLRSAGSPGLQVIFDHGPLGMPPSFGHGHADALSLVVRADGRELLADTGTGSYSGEPSWRRYFRSTAAHNTVCVDGEDQAAQETAFRWSAPYRCELLRAQSGAAGLRALARHDGYRGRGVVHWRGVAVHDPGWLLVWDLLEGRGRHGLELHWHVAVTVNGSDGRFRIGADTMLEIAGGEAVICRSGSEEALVGWRSVRYGRREPIHTVAASHTGALPHEFVTRMYPAAAVIPEAVVSDDIDWFRRSIP